GAPVAIEPGPKDARIVALVLSPSAAVAYEPAAAPAACDPAASDEHALRELLCFSATPVAWWRRNHAPASVPRASIPFWLSMLESRREPDVLARIPALLALARRLNRVGFEATTLEGVTEVPGGVRIAGRADEDAIVAVGLGPNSPWVFPYTDS